MYIHLVLSSDVGCVGVEVSNEEIERTVGEIFEENKATILEQRYRTNGGYAHLGGI